ncbi:hypothetical protein [Mycoplasma sp. 005V]|uniref:hypothetical protein n=1 Tax=unclassified Mycoplasma TaxID=2683645 RepID=UPI003A85CB43
MKWKKHKSLLLLFGALITNSMVVVPIVSTNTAKSTVNDDNIINMSFGPQNIFEMNKIDYLNWRNIEDNFIENINESDSWKYIVTAADKITPIINNMRTDKIYLKKLADKYKNIFYALEIMKLASDDNLLKLKGYNELIEEYATKYGMIFVKASGNENDFRKILNDTINYIRNINYEEFKQEMLLLYNYLCKDDRYSGYLVHDILKNLDKECLQQYNELKYALIYAHHNNQIVSDLFKNIKSNIFNMLKMIHDEKIKTVNLSPNKLSNMIGTGYNFFTIKQDWDLKHIKHIERLDYKLAFKTPSLHTLIDFFEKWSAESGNSVKIKAVKSISGILTEYQSKHNNKDFDNFADIASTLYLKFGDDKRTPRYKESTAFNAPVENVYYGEYEKDGLELEVMLIMKQYGAMLEALEKEYLNSWYGSWKAIGYPDLATLKSVFKEYYFKYIDEVAEVKYILKINE